jgi:hypothetical protein
VPTPASDEIERVCEHPRAEWDGDIEAAIHRAKAEPIGS